MNLMHQIETIMKSEKEVSPGWLRSSLAAISVVYGGGVRLRTAAFDKNILRSKHLPCIVISIGNLTMGGTGKTPMTIYLAEVLERLGYRVVILSRGYGGRAESSGGIVSDGHQICMRADECGDEPYMMARRLKTVPVLVGKNRYQSGMKAMQLFQPDIILLDDAFQHRYLARDLDLVLLDAQKPFGNGFLFPRGILREPALSLNRSHAVVVTRAGKMDVFSEKIVQPYFNSGPVFFSQHKPYLVKIVAGKAQAGTDRNEAIQNRDIQSLRGKRVLAFAGIARNDDFFKQLAGLGCELLETVSFSDHHSYTDFDLSRIKQSALDQQVDCLLTTEKDYRRMSSPVSWPMDLVVLGVDLVFKDNSFDEFIAERLTVLRSEGHR